MQINFINDNKKIILEILGGFDPFDLDSGVLADELVESFFEIIKLGAKNGVVGVMGKRLSKVVAFRSQLYDVENGFVLPSREAYSGWTGI